MGYGLLTRARSLVRRGRAVVAASSPCREKCCEGASHVYCGFCPCDQPGCWRQRPIVWVRDDVTCADGRRVCDFNEGPAMIRVNGWCYTPSADLPITADPPPDGVRIDAGPVECVPVGDYAPVCDNPACLPPGGGDCQCGNCQPQDYSCACSRVCTYPPPFETSHPCQWCCAGEFDENGNVPWTFSFGLRIVVTNTNGPWDCGCNFYGECSGVSFRSAVTANVGQVLERDGCRQLVRIVWTRTVQRRVPCSFGSPACPCPGGDTCHCCDQLEQETWHVDEWLSPGQFPTFEVPLIGFDTGGAEDCSVYPDGPCQGHCSDLTCYYCVRGRQRHTRCTSWRAEGGYRIGEVDLFGAGCCFHDRRAESWAFVRWAPAVGGSCCAQCMAGLCGAEGGSGGQDCSYDDAGSPEGPDGTGDLRALFRGAA